jgi:hypothetical protein
LGKRSYEEKVLLIVFVSLAMLWVFRADIVIGSFRMPGWSSLFNQPQLFNDGTVAILVAIILFIIPSKQEPGKFLMDWKAAEDIPWEIILLFGGGFALASGFKESGLSSWFGEQLMWLKGVHPLILILSISFLITFLTEVTSNTATVESFPADPGRPGHQHRGEPAVVHAAGHGGRFPGVYVAGGYAAQRHRIRQPPADHLRNGQSRLPAQPDRDRGGDFDDVLLWDVYFLGLRLGCFRGGAQGH